MLHGFHQYLIDKGFKRTCSNLKGEIVENYDSLFVSTGNPLGYEYRKDNHYCYWGLSIQGMPPNWMLCGGHKMKIIQNKDNPRCYEQGYQILFSKWKEDKYDLMYRVLTTDYSRFVINCTNESNITIEVEFNVPHIGNRPTDMCFPTNASHNS